MYREIAPSKDDNNKMVVITYDGPEKKNIIEQETYDKNDPAFELILKSVLADKKKREENPYQCNVIVEEHNAENSKTLKTIALSSIITLGVVGILGMGGCFYYKAQLSKQDASDSKSAIELSIDEKEKEETKDTPDNTNDIPDNAEPKVEETTPVVEEIQPKSVEELKSESRYTEVTEENLTSGTQKFMNDLAANGIDLDGADALTFATVGNITHMNQTNNELAKEVFSSYPDKESVMTKTGHIIGQVATLEIVKGVHVDWTVIFVDETDRKIALHSVETLNMCREVAANTELTEEQKATQIQSIIQERFVKPNYDKSVGYEYNGERIAKSQEDGADFITDALFTGIVMGDNKLKDYVYGSETMDDMLAIAANEDVVSNMHTIIEDCQSKVR